VKRVYGAYKVLLLGFCLESTLVAQSIAPRTFRAVAGETRTAALSDGVPVMTTITSTRLMPPLEFPIRVLTISAPEPRLRLVIPPATPPGEYTIEVAGRDGGGRSLSTALHVTVDAVTVKHAAAAARPPVVLLNGFQLVCFDDASTLTGSQDTFGQLATLLQDDGASVLYFNNCAYGDKPIEQLGAQLGIYIAGLQYTDGTPVSQVDLVAHSMGGLIARAYLAGKSQTSGVFFPPANPMVRKLVAIGTPHFGSFQAAYIGVQESEMALGNQFLWDLATWNQGQDDLRGVDAIAIIGNAGSYGNTENASDGVVSLTSGSLGFVESDQRTRIVPYCHIPPDLLTDLGFGMSCSAPEGIANIDSPSHLSAQIIRSFLADTTAWESIGNPPSTDPFLSIYGGGLVALKGTNDIFFTDLTSVQYDNGTGSLVAGPSASIASIFYTEFAPGGSHNFSMTHSDGQVTTGTGTFVDGSARAVLFKFGPSIYSVQSSLPTGLPGLTVASGSTITINGVGFSSSTGTSVLANGAPLSGQIVSDQEITALLPSHYSGLVSLSVSNSAGQDAINIVVAPPAQPPMISLSLTQLQFSYAVGGVSPAAQTVTVANSGGGSFTWSASSNVSWLNLSTAPGQLTVSVNPSGLAPGPYSGIISVAGTASNSPQTVSVALTVAAQAPAPPSISLSTSQANFIYTVGGAAPAPQTISISNSGGGALSWSATPSASWIPVVSASNSVSISVNPTNLSPGAYTGSVTVTAAGAVNSPQTISVMLLVNAPPVSPGVTAVVNGASFGGGGIVPGEIATIFGSNLTSITGTNLTPSLPLPTEFLKVSVILDGAPVPLFAVDDVGGQQQINFQIPWRVASESTATIAITNNGSVSPAISVPVLSAQPGIFGYSVGGQVFGAVLHANFQLADIAHPVEADETVLIYCTGLGAVSSPPGDGVPANGQPTTVTPNVTIGGTPATVSFSGLAPGFVGLNQVNVRVPSGLKSGNQALVMTISGASSNSVLLPVT